MSTYDQWKTDPDFDNRQAEYIEAQEIAEQKEHDRIRKLELKASAFDWLAQFIRRIEHANHSDLDDLAMRVGRLPDLLLTCRDIDEIKF